MWYYGYNVLVASAEFDNARISLPGRECDIPSARLVGPSTNGYAPSVFQSTHLLGTADPWGVLQTMGV